MKPHRSLLLAAGAVLAVAALALTGCTAAPAPATDPGAATATTAASCVADPAKTASLPATLPSTPVSSTLAAKLVAASESGRAEISSPGAIVAVQTPQGRWMRAFGVADPVTGRAMTVDDVQRIGSVTKTFTGTLILQLVQEGRISLDDTIDRYVDGVPNGAEITLDDLLTMKSGLASYTLNTDLQNEWFADPTEPWTPAQLLHASFALEPIFAPGAKFNYSNTNFILLGEVIQRVTGESYATVLQERILTPLGLTHTAMPAGDAPLPDPHADGSSLQGTADGDTTPVNATEWNPTFAWTAGQMISTIGDMLTWGRVLGTGHDVLDRTTQLDRLESMPAAGGYGDAIGCIDGWIGHTGEIPGYNTSVFYDTTTDTTVIVFANSDIMSGACTESKTLPDNPTSAPCMAPATRVFVAVAEALGHPFAANPAS
ncbi:serine hydrolase domain-containing protein [Leifsonia sp. NPDC058194]|uniref:serine hydrolase domain-containing protein n=1 Tax=Leifsonia sp. NPDC058194 TaxID=3346374 RepID=UPI0036DF044F